MVKLHLINVKKKVFKMITCTIVDER